jgi:hypothetical protein
MGIKDKYAILQVSHGWVKEMIVEKHYLHRMSQASYAFGLFDRSTKELEGVITYGKPASPSLCNSICGEDESSEVMELTRLWTKDETPRNTESWLIANSMKKVDGDIIVSYADDSEGHKGYVYQATNWLYTGMGAGGYQWKVKGENKHSRHLLDKYESIDEAKEELGDKLYREEISKKHRYVFFNANKRRKRELKEKLSYPIKEYPKG